MPVDIAAAFSAAVNTIVDPVSLFLIIVVTCFGLMMGSIPGIGGTTTLALLIPLTFGMDPRTAFMVLAAALGAVNFGGSISAILLNTPGTPVNAATLFDGFPMARDGRAAEALGVSATASALGAILGIIVLALSIPVIMPIILAFGPPEVFWLSIWGLTVVAIVVRGAVITGLVAAGMGLMFAYHGMNTMTATIRWSYGLVWLQDGFKLIPALIGLFAIAEMINLVSEGGHIANDGEMVELTGSKWTGVKSVLTNKYLFVRSAILGSAIGIIPGVGGTTATYISYFQAMQTSKDPEKFGTGEVRGVIAAEAANDAKDGGSFIPTLGLGIPGSANMAVLLGAFLLHGIIPGPRLFQQHLDIVMVIILALLIANVLTSVIGLLGAEKFSLITRVDIQLLAPIVIGVAFFGTFTLNNNVYDLFIATFFGLLGFAMIEVDVSRVPLILAMVLGPIIEKNFFRSLQISETGYAVFLRSPLTALLIALIIAGLLIPLVKPYLPSMATLTPDR